MVVLCCIIWSMLNCFFGLSSYVTGNRLFLYYVFEIQLFLRPQLLHYREQTVLVLRVRNSTISSASAPILQGTGCWLYYVFETQLFLWPQLLRYREQTVACITRFEIQLFLRPHCILNHPLSVGLSARKYVLAAPCIFVTSSQPSVTVPWRRRHNSSSKFL